MRYKKAHKFNVRVKVKRILFEKMDSSFKIFTATVREQENLTTRTKSGRYLKGEETFAGDVIYLSVGDEVQIEASVDYSAKYGYTMKFTEQPKEVMPENRGALIDFIVRKVKGCGKATAVKIVDAFGLDVFDIVSFDENALERIGITKKKADSFREALKKYSSISDLMLFMSQFGWQTSKVIAVHEKWPSTALTTMKLNPYEALEVERITFEDVDKVAHAMQLAANSILRLQAAIVEMVEERVNSFGDLAVKREQIESGLRNYLNRFGAYTPAENEAINELAIGAAIKGALNQTLLKQEVDKKQGELLYLTKFWQIENSIVNHIRMRFEANAVPLVSPSVDIEEVLENIGKVSREQKNAVKMAANEMVSILTGGPGTGKTFTVNAIVKTIEALNPEARIVLMAPTGKAAKRMSEMTGKEATTIHRKLQINEFADSAEMLDADFVIVDESSMIDAALFNQLLKYTTETTRILLVGDIDQLPSVGAGLILRDLIDSGRIPVTMLTQVFRQAQESQIVTNAHKINKGILTKDVDGIELRKDNSDMVFVEEKEEEKVKNLVIEKVKEELEKGTKIDDIAVLTAMRKGEIGVDMLNRTLQAELNPEKGGKDQIKRTRTRNGQEIEEIIRVGDKVMQVVNNTEKDTMNGETGVVERVFLDMVPDERGNVKSAQVVEVDYGQNKIVQYFENELDEMELAYAMTIHKSQGSEYKTVVTVVHERQSIMLQRNLIYTAVTRAKEKLVMVGTEEALNIAIRRTENTKRLSLLKEKLKKELKAKQPAR